MIEICAEFRLLTQSVSVSGEDEDFALVAIGYLLLAFDIVRDVAGYVKKSL